MRTSLSRSPLTLVLALLGLALAACGTGGGGGTTDAGAGGDVDNTLVIGMTATNIPLLDTTLSQNEGYEGIRFVGNQLYDALSRFDLSDPGKIPDVVPALAESWEPNEDLTVWTIGPVIGAHGGPRVMGLVWHEAD